MADSLVLTGTKQVTKHTGTEMTRVDPLRGGNTWQLKRWWLQGNGTVYTPCTVFKVEAGGASGYLAVEAVGEGVNMKIVHDGSFNFEFFYINEASRAALYDDSWGLVEHYVFPRISGGKVMTVTPPDAAEKPGSGPAPAPETEIGAVVASGDTTADDGDQKIYSAAAASATASPLAYGWTATGDATISAGATTASATVDFSYSTGTATLVCQVTSTDEGVTDSPADSNTITVTVNAP